MDTQKAQNAFAGFNLVGFIIKSFLMLIIGYLLGNLIPVQALKNGCAKMPIDSVKMQFQIKDSSLIIGDTNLTPEQKRIVDSFRKAHNLQQ